MSHVGFVKSYSSLESIWSCVSCGRKSTHPRAVSAPGTRSEEAGMTRRHDSSGLHIFRRSVLVLHLPHCSSSAHARERPRPSCPVLSSHTPRTPTRNVWRCGGCGNTGDSPSSLFVRSGLHKCLCVAVLNFVHLVVIHHPGRRAHKSDIIDQECLNAA